MQSRIMRVKCQPDGELPAGRRAAGRPERTEAMPLAVHIPHPAAAHKREYLLMSSFTGCCKGGIFYEKFEANVQRLLS